MEQKNKQLYVVFNGDNVGKNIGDAIASDNREDLQKLGGSIDEAHSFIEQWVEENGGEIITSSGDETLVSISPELGQSIQELKEEYQSISGSTVTIGIGSSMSEAFKALIAGKLSGKDQILEYSDEVEQLISDSGAEEEVEESIDEEIQEDIPSEDDLIEEKASQQLESVGEGEEDIDSELEEMRPPIDEAGYAEGEIPEEDFEEDSEEFDISESPEDELDEEMIEAQARPDINELKHRGESITDEDREDANLRDMMDDDIVEEDEEDPSDDFISEADEEMDEAIYEDDYDESAEPNKLDRISNKVGELDENITNLSEDEIAQIEMEQEMGSDEEMPIEDEMPEDEDQYGMLTDMIHGHLEGEEEMPEEDLEGMPLEEGADQDELRSDIVNSLQIFKDNKDILEQAQEANPALYQATITMLRAMIEMARQLNMNPDQEMIDEESEMELMDQLPPNESMENMEDVPMGKSERQPLKLMNRARMTDVAKQSIGAAKKDLKNKIINQDEYDRVIRDEVRKLKKPKNIKKQETIDGVPTKDPKDAVGDLDPKNKEKSYNKQSIKPKRTFSQKNAPDKLRVGDRVDHSKSPKALTGTQLYGKPNLGKKEVCSPAEDMVEEHERLVDTLRSKNPKKQKKEAKTQAKELKEYKEKAKGKKKTQN